MTSYTQGYDKSTLKSHQSRTAELQADYLLPHIKPTHRILDIGCGPGTITCDFAKYVPQGSVVGVDFSEQVLDQATAEATKRGSNNVTFQFASAHELPFEDESFDIVHCHAVLVHMPDAPKAVREMRRVCRAGGFVAAREPDWDTCVIHPHNPILEKWKSVSAELKRHEGAEPNAGRFLAQWAIAAGFAPDDVAVTSNVLQYAGRQEIEWWASLYAARVHTEFGERAVKLKLVEKKEAIDEFATAYLEWSKDLSAGPIWAMMHMRMLCKKS